MLASSSGSSRNFVASPFCCVRGSACRTAAARLANGSPVPRRSGVSCSANHCSSPALPASNWSRGITPAATSDDLPLPLAPTTATNGCAVIRATSASISRSRPKKIGASAAVNARSPGNGDPCQGSGKATLARLVCGFSRMRATRLLRSCSRRSRKSPGTSYRVYPPIAEPAKNCLTFSYCNRRSSKSGASASSITGCVLR